jgi:hypothetical protein
MLLSQFDGLVEVKTEGVMNCRIRRKRIAPSTPCKTGCVYYWQRLEKKEQSQRVLDICPTFYRLMFCSKFGFSWSIAKRRIDTTRLSIVFSESPISRTKTAILLTHNPPLVETFVKKSYKDICMTGEFFYMDDGKRGQAMEEIVWFVERNELSVEGEHVQFEWEEGEKYRTHGPQQIGTFILIYLLEMKWINKNTIRRGVAFSNTHGYAHSKRQDMNNEQDILWKDENFLDLDPIDMFHHAANIMTMENDAENIGEIIDELSGVEWKSFEMLMKLSGC